jgi:ABC-type Fe3+/spermidine/putrescine transport system ATPase subunit
VLALAGKSGCGKTTLVKCIYGLEDLQAGEVKIDDELVTGPAYNLIPGHKDMSLVSQDFYVLDNHTVTENITDKLIGYTDEYKQKRASQLLKLLELNHLKDTKARFLSSGQKQRVAIARALTIIPKLLLLDEPFSNLDKLLTDKLFAFINKEVKRNHTSVILVTHAAEEAIKYADRIAIMDDGRITQMGEKWKVYYQPKNTKLAGLLGDYNIIRKEDLEKNSRVKIRSKIILRPDKIKLSEGKNSARLTLTISNCTYNGKCFELLGETKNGHTVIFYSSKEIREGKEIITYIES